LVLKTIVAFFIALAIPAFLSAQPDDWRKPFEGHRVVANLYYVGGYDLACFLITSPEGHILINTGLDDSTPLLRNSIESLGFRMADVKILLTMQAHWDHTAALAEIKKTTGAKMWATASDAPILEDGGMSDPQFGGRVSFAPVKVDRRIKDGETIRLGDTRLGVVLSPGHTTGSVSYTMKVREGGRDYNVVIANMASINKGKRLVDRPTYPGVAKDFADTFRKQKALPCDIWVAAHGSQYNLHAKYKAGDSYAPEIFVDPQGYLAAVERHEKLYLDQLKAEQN